MNRKELQKFLINRKVLYSVVMCMKNNHYSVIINNNLEPYFSIVYQRNSPEISYYLIKFNTEHVVLSDLANVSGGKYYTNIDSRLVINSRNRISNSIEITTDNLIENCHWFDFYDKETFKNKILNDTSIAKRDIKSYKSYIEDRTFIINMNDQICDILNLKTTNSNEK